MMDVEFFDIDTVIERNQKSSITEIFSVRGEREFRRMEKLETKRALAGPFAVVVPGGGWAAEGKNVEDVQNRALSVYLETTPETAAARVGGSDNRPLLNGPDPLTRMKDLLTIRRPFYENCSETVSTDRKTVREVAKEIVELAQGATGG
jgi:shikimate kinase